MRFVLAVAVVVIGQLLDHAAGLNVLDAIEAVRCQDWGVSDETDEVMQDL